MASTLVYRDGSYFWNDYSYNAIVDNTNIPTTSLIGRFHDSTNYFVCNFKNGNVSMEIFRNNVKTTAGSAGTALPVRGSSVSLGVRAIGSTASCLVGGTEAFSYSGDLIPANGGLGFKFFNSSNSDPLIVKQIDAVAE